MFREFIQSLLTLEALVDLAVLVALLGLMVGYAAVQTANLVLGFVAVLLLAPLAAHAWYKW